MKKGMTKLAVGVLAAGTLLVSGCGLFHSSKTNSVPNNTAETKQANLYFVDSNGYVVPLASNLPKDNPSPAGQALKYLVQGGEGEQLLKGTGLATVLPKGTTVQLNISKDGTATVDLSKDVLNYKTLKEEQDIVESIVWTLTEFANIKQVQFQIGGQIKPTLPQGTPIKSPISRDSGINLQVASNTNPSDSSHVTVYLMDTTSTGKQYLVPVTRVIPKVDQADLVKAALMQLANADGHMGLKSTLPSEDVLSSPVKLDKDVAHVDLKANVFPQGASQSAQADILKSVWMSVAANLHVSKVQLTVQGKPVPLVSGSVSGSIDWSKPVSDLHYINQQPDKSI